MNDDDVKQRVQQTEEDVVELAVSMRRMIDYMERAVQMVESLTDRVEDLKERVEELERALSAKADRPFSAAGASLRRVQ